MDYDQLSQDQKEALERVASWYSAVRVEVEYCGGVDGENGSDGDGGMFAGSDDCPKGPHTHSPISLAPILALGGLAGTGKTSIVKWLHHKLDADITYGTPTHKAARVLRGKLEGDERRKVSTFYSLTYLPDPKHICMVSGWRVEEGTKECTCDLSEDECACPRVFLPCDKHAGECVVKENLDWIQRRYMKGHTELLVVDEASMLSEDQVLDIAKFGVPMLLVGDHGQLPPVKARMNRWIANPDVVLTENHRQKSDESGIVDLALSARGGIQMRRGTWGDGSTLVLGKDDERVGALLNAQRYRSRSEDARTWPVIITATNKMRAGINRMFHGEGGLRAGDRVVALRRCEVEVVTAVKSGAPVMAGYKRMVHNGHTGTVHAVMGVTPLAVSFVVELDDTDGVLVWVDRCAPDQFGAENVLSEDKRAKNARLWDYAYAISGHKSQGSEWDDVIVVDDSFQDRDRWRYTAITRARKRLVVITFRE